MRCTSREKSNPHFCSLKLQSFNQSFNLTKNSHSTCGTGVRCLATFKSNRHQFPPLWLTFIHHIDTIFWYLGHRVLLCTQFEIASGANGADTYRHYFLSTFYFLIFPRFTCAIDWNALPCAPRRLIAATLLRNLPRFGNLRLGSISTFGLHLNCLGFWLHTPFVHLIVGWFVLFGTGGQPNVILCPFG